jgi:hypothetical protein
MELMRADWLVLQMVSMKGQKRDALMVTRMAD